MAPIITALAATAFPASMAMLVAPIVYRCALTERTASTRDWISGYSSNPAATMDGRTGSRFIRMRVSLLPRWRLLTVSAGSNPIIMSAPPSASRGLNTSSPILTVESTLPPLCAIPWTSLIMTFIPADIAALPRTLEAKRTPCPPTPTICTVYFISSPL